MTVPITTLSPTSHLTALPQRRAWRSAVKSVPDPGPFFFFPLLVLPWRARFEGRCLATAAMCSDQRAAALRFAVPPAAMPLERLLVPSRSGAGPALKASRASIRPTSGMSAMSVLDPSPAPPSPPPPLLLLSSPEIEADCEKEDEDDESTRKENPRTRRREDDTLGFAALPFCLPRPRPRKLLLLLSGRRAGRTEPAAGALVDSTEEPPLPLPSPPPASALPVMLVLRCSGLRIMAAAVDELAVAAAEDDDDEEDDNAMPLASGATLLAPPAEIIVISPRICLDSSSPQSVLRLPPPVPL